MHEAMYADTYRDLSTHLPMLQSLYDEINDIHFHCVHFNVYHKNQNFRLVASLKFDIKRCLKRDSTFSNSKFLSMNIYDFLSSTISTNFDVNCTIFTNEMLDDAYFSLLLYIDAVGSKAKKVTTAGSVYPNLVPSNMEYNLHKMQFTNMLANMHNLSDEDKVKLIEAFDVIYYLLYRI
ncbi:uncharacterized protein LOC116417323 [Nasonia vitripennis]|uniref:Uncharacterized protein n=1 Tax=Nasonia vitripennis TaxID=7425 RepID=A0A7M7QI45_NASVI|nr:uncharacterized protein LOC116417323 [Nasonia vitripennis]